MFFISTRNLKSPIAGIIFYEATDPRLFRSYGILRDLGISYIDPAVIRWMIALTVVSWIFSAIGLLTRASMIVCAAGFVFLHGVFLASNALNHYYFLPMYTLVALCFSRTNDRWSIDYHLHRWRGTQTDREKGFSVSETGFAAS